jgi:hypothetical protein
MLPNNSINHSIVWLCINYYYYYYYCYCYDYYYPTIRTVHHIIPFLSHDFPSSINPSNPSIHQSICVQFHVISCHDTILSIVSYYIIPSLWLCSQSVSQSLPHSISPPCLSHQFNPDELRTHAYVLCCYGL